MDLSALIFVALAVAWAAYLLPKTLKHHDDAVLPAAAEKVGSSLRILARRDAGAPEETAADSDAAEVTAPVKVRIPWEEMSPEQRRTRHVAAVTAAKRRMRVFLLLITANVVVGGLAAFGLVATLYLAIPAGLLVAWLVACRLMVRNERQGIMVWQTDSPAVDEAPSAEAPSTPPPSGRVSRSDAQISDNTEEIMAAGLPADASDDAAAGEVSESPVGQWSPQSAPLPTYVSKQAAPRRTINTIDLDSTGVWTSGPSEEDSALVRDAEVAEQRGQSDGGPSRAVGS